jgi:uncharacterized LabA/DUF88 family protein
VATKKQVEALATDPSARVMVFIDGQNLYKTCRRLFGRPLINPRLLAEHLAGPRTRHSVACRFYTGRPNPNVRGEKNRTRNLDRRLHAIRGTGVTTVTRPLRYHWDWGHREKLPRAHRTARPQTVKLYPWQRPQEKGIDVVMALDVIEFLVTDHCDVAIIVSLDRDLAEIPGALDHLRKLIERPYRLEAAVPVVASRRYPKTLAGFNYTHQITPDVFEIVKDETDYSVSDSKWVAPQLPRTLAEAKAAAEEAASGEEDAA